MQNIFDSLDVLTDLCAVGRSRINMLIDIARTVRRAVRDRSNRVLTIMRVGGECIGDAAC